MKQILKKYYNFYYKRYNFYKRHQTIYFTISLSLLIFGVFVFKNIVLDSSNIPSGSMVPTLKVGDFLFVNKMRYSISAPLPFVQKKLFLIDTPERGDIVTFTPPIQAGLTGKTLVKRIIGMPGDIIQVTNNSIMVNSIAYPIEIAKDKKILNNMSYADGRKQDFTLWKERIIDPETKDVVVEHYILQKKYFYDESKRSPNKTYVIPQEHYMMMGDNRDDSDDSRSWNYVHISNIQGKVFVSFLSVNFGSYSFPHAYDSSPVSSFLNPFHLIKDIVSGNIQNAYIRWERTFMRIK